MDHDYRPEIAVIRNRAEHMMKGLADVIYAPAPGVEERATDDLRTAFRSANEAFEALEAGIAEAARVVNDPIWSEDEQRRRHDEAIRAAITTAEQAAENVTTRVASLHGRLERAALPTRPQGDTAGQEAALANLRSDLRMQLDSVGNADLVAELTDALRRAVDDGDRLATWMLAASSWPATYLRSRHAEPADAELAAELFAREVPDVLDPARSTDQRKARSYLTLWERTQGQNSMRDVVTLVTTGVALSVQDMPTFTVDPED